MDNKKKVDRPLIATGIWYILLGAVIFLSYRVKTVDNTEQCYLLGIRFMEGGDIIMINTIIICMLVLLFAALPILLMLFFSQYSKLEKYSSEDPASQDK